jgi:uncharacterized protein (TIGR02284 family)
MTTDNDLNLTPDGMRQSSSLTGMTSISALESPAGTYIDSRDAEDLNGNAIDTLNDLLEICRDGEYGFRECAEHTKALDVKTVLNQRASECHFAGTELQAMIKHMGSEPKEGGTASAALHRGWVSVKGTLSGYSDYDMLDECERAEDVALAQYRKARKQSLPPSAMVLVEKQTEGVQRNHDQIKAMRDTLTTQK